MEELGITNQVSNIDISIASFALGLISVGAMTYVLGILFVRYSQSVSNKKSFANNFVLIGVTTMLIISIVKSSLALSLGLVGALSIIRFRTAIKEPEELAYLFLTISVGLGFGAGQYKVTVLAFILTSAFIVLRGKRLKKNIATNMYVTIQSTEPQKLTLDETKLVLEKRFEGISLRRFDNTSEGVEISLEVSFSDIDELNRFSSDIKKIDPGASVLFIDHSGISF